MTIAIWTRPGYEPGGARGSVSLFGFSVEPLTPGVEFSMRRYGAPSAESMAGLDLRSHTREESPEWFDNWLTGPVRTIATGDLRNPDHLDNARHCHAILSEVDDPADHTHLQAAWAAARWLAERGCFAFIDAHAGRWFDGSTLTNLAPDRSFDLDAEIRFIFETNPTPDFGHALHTRGMAKFGRPDLITGVQPDEVGVRGQVLRQLARSLADGARARLGQGINVDNGHAFSVLPYEPAHNAPEVHLNNDGLLIVPA